MSNPTLLTIREASNRLGLQESTLRKWLLQRRIAYCKLGRSVRVPAQVVEKLIAEGYREAIVTGGGSDH
jgi:excisionase family DNA binding protein